jgi:hypothetical protein
LRATIEWSYDLLEADEQRLLARLAVFRGGCTLEATEAVCDADLDRLQSLVDKSLLRVREDQRFWMLETIREFAAERLRDSGEEDAVRRRHAEYFLRVAESAHMTADTIELGQRFDVAGAELDNFRAAIEGAAESGDVASALEIALSLESLWVAQQPQEGARRLEELMEAAGELPPEVRARALRAYGGIVFISGDFERGTALHEEALEVFRSLGDELAVAHVLHRLAMGAAGDGDYVRARTLSDESLATHRRYGSRSGEAMAVGVYVNIAVHERRYEEALELALKSASLAGEVGFAWWQVHYLYVACEMCLDLDRLGEAEKWGCEGLALGVEIGNRQVTVYLLALLSAVAAAEGDPERSGVLWGALEREEARGSVGQWESEREAYRSRVKPNDLDQFELGRARGSLLSPAEALDHAASETST